jgi:hypothetical protein
MAVLANSFCYTALLRYPHSSRENVADAQVLAINCGSLNVGRFARSTPFFPPVVVKVVIFTDHNGVMFLGRGYTVGTKRTALAMVAPFEAVDDLAPGLVDATT